MNAFHTGNMLFEPLNIGDCVVPGRIIKTATAETMATPDGFVTDELVRFYELYAIAGTPLIITGNLYPQVSGKVYTRMPGADGDDKLDGLRRLPQAVHRHGSMICAQLSHGGRQVFQRSANNDPVSASSVLDKLTLVKPRAMTTAEIHQFVSDFAKAAERCQRAGFDAVQIHAAHGYLLSQFLTPYTNRRTDEYGGSFTNRMKLLMDVYHATRERVGGTYPILIKINGADALPLRKGLKTSELVEITRILQEEGLDGVEISVGHYESGFPTIHGTFNRFYKDLIEHGVGREYPVSQRFSLKYFRWLMAPISNQLWKKHEGFNLRYARQFKEKLTIPVICVGGFQTRQAMEQAIISGQCDAVSSARAFIADPFLVKHVRENEAGPECDFCSACLAHLGTSPVDCYNPRVKKEKDKMLAIEMEHAVQ